FMYHLGRDGVERDCALAAKWFRLAANQGSAAAQNSLGVLYEEGLGIRTDIVEAIHLFRMAAEQGEPRAQANLARMIDAIPPVSLPGRHSGPSLDRGPATRGVAARLAAAAR